LRWRDFPFTKAVMADDEKQPDRIWDEYEWERFFQVQDKKTEHYLDLLERYADHPERDAIIAQEMGWPLTWGTDLEEEFAEKGACSSAASGAGEPAVRPEECSESHPLYQQAEALSLWLENAWRVRGAFFEGEPVLDELSEQVGILSANIVASLSGHDDGEVGMTLAFLKRALRAANLALNAAERVHRMGIFGRVRHKHLRDALFGIRGEIVQMIGHFRQEWRRLQDGSNGCPPPR
jgi:hypothetical protein